YTQDAFSRSGWLWPVDAKGEPLKATSYMAVGFYVAKYVNKKSDMDLAAKGLGAKEWNNSLKTKLSLLPKKLFRIRMSRNFGMKMLTMTNLSTECLIQLTKLGYDATPFNQILKQNAKREMRLRLGKVTVADVLAAQPVTTNLLKFMRASIKMIGVSNLQSFIASMTQKLTLSDISDERSEERFSRNAETDLVCRLLLEKKKILTISLSHHSISIFIVMLPTPSRPTLFPYTTLFRSKVTVADVLAAQPVTTNLLKFMRASIKMIGVSNLQSFIASMTQKLTLSDISDESKNYLDKAGITTACLRIKSKWTAGGK